MQEPKLGTIIDAGIDYITVTAARGPRALELYDRGRRIFKNEVQQGNEVKGWSMKGYSGFAAGGVSFGGREDGSIVRLSSDVAASDWFEVYQVADNVSRVDLQVTVRLDHDPTLRLHLHEKALKRKWRDRNDGPWYGLRRDCEKGCTLNVGKRTSAIHLRAYNKHVESKSDYYVNCLRYEAEIKKRAAAIVTKSLADSPMVRPALVDGLHRCFRDRGIVPLFPSDARKSIYALLPRSPSDADRKLEWLGTAIRPSIQFLIECGRLDDVLDCLDLAQFVECKSTEPKP